MIVGLNWNSLILGFVIVVYAATCCGGESSTCLMVYREGGAPAVFQSPKCPRWNLPNQNSRPRFTTTSSRCQSAMLQGRRKSQEDRVLCLLDFRIPFPGKAGLKEVMVGIMAVFDGHNGAEASEMASKLLLEYFALHTYFLLDAAYSLLVKNSLGQLPNKGEKDVYKVLNMEGMGWHDLDFKRFKEISLPANFDDSFHLEILKEALLRAVNDIDVKFSKEASRNNLDSGSTASIVLIADDQILAANIGDSKALLCSEKFQSPAEAKATLLRSYRERRHHRAVSPARDFYNVKSSTSNGLKHFSVVELTRDHHPDRDDERFRVEAAGGYVHEFGGVSRVNGQLAVSRAIGDVHFKSYGVISSPEMTDWQRLTGNDSYLVVASDGMFEKLSLQDVCDLLWEVHSGTEGFGLSSSCLYSLAECLVNTAFEKGSMDNLAAVVVPLGSFGISDTAQRQRCIGLEDMYCSTMGLNSFTHEKSADDIKSDLVQLENGRPLVARFDRLLVEEKHGTSGCYYLSENLNDNMYTFLPQKNNHKMYALDLPQALPEAFDHRNGSHLNLYSDPDLCLQWLTVDGVKDQCINVEGFTSFLALLESIPFHDTGSTSGTNEHATPDLRYVLKKRFGRGAYGEVWLAIYWHCHGGPNNSSCTQRNENISFDTGYFMSNIKNSSGCTTHDWNASFPDDDLFILKRIMVERGAAVYLSGLREKYFGELFLNASRCLGSLLSDGMTASLVEESLSDSHDLLETNGSVYGLGNSWSSENTFVNQFMLQGPAYEEGLNNIARYVESFESRSNEIWLVFRHEGVSLSKLMYTMEEIENNVDEGRTAEGKRIQVLRPSKWWHWLKTTDAGNEEMRNLIWQLLMGLKSCHDRNITHRDIKPENMVICFEDLDTGRCLRGVPNGDKNYTTKMRIIDFGSAIDEFTVKHLYGSTGPSRAEQTYEYAPPEASLNATWFQGHINMKYDMWSVGVVILELIIGSPNVFQISDVTRALLDQHIEGWNDHLKELAYKLRSLMELCILIPGTSSKHHHAMDHNGVSPASWKCSEEFFSHQIKSRDPLKLGFPNVWALRLVRRLLLWDPGDRLSVDDALQHPYFQPPPKR